MPRENFPEHFLFLNKKQLQNISFSKRSATNQMKDRERAEKKKGQPVWYNRIIKHKKEVEGQYPL